MPPMRFRRLVLPQPLGPIKATGAPGANSRVTRSSAVTSAAAVEYFLVSSTTRTEARSALTEGLARRAAEHPAAKEREDRDHAQDQETADPGGLHRHRELRLQIRHDGAQLAQPPHQICDAVAHEQRDRRAEGEARDRRGAQPGGEKLQQLARSAAADAQQRESAAV